VGANQRRHSEKCLPIITARTIGQEGSDVAVLFAQAVVSALRTICPIEGTDCSIRMKIHPRNKDGSGIDYLPIPNPLTTVRGQLGFSGSAYEAPLPKGDTGLQLGWGIEPSPYLEYPDAV